MLQDIDAVLRLRTLSQLLQAATVCMMLFHWVSFASCNPSIERIRNTLASSAPDLGHFFVLLGILLVLAAGLCHVALGDQLRSMSTMSGSIESMFMLMVASYLGGINDLVRTRPPPPHQIQMCTNFFSGQHPLRPHLMAGLWPALGCHHRGGWHLSSPTL